MLKKKVEEEGNRTKRLRKSKSFHGEQGKNENGLGERGGRTDGGW